MPTDYENNIDTIEPYTPVALYYDASDTVEYLRRDVPCVYRRVDGVLTLALDMDTREPVGFRVKGFKNFYLRRIKPVHQKLNDDSFVHLVYVIERLVEELCSPIFENEEQRLQAYRVAAEIARKDKVELHDLPRAA